MKMTSKKNLKKMRKNHKNHKEIGPNAKKFAAGTASVLLGAGIAASANVRPVKASGYREDEIAEVESANVLGSEKAKVRISVQQRTNDTLVQEGETEDQQTTDNTQPATQNNAETLGENGSSDQANTATSDTDTTSINSAIATTTDATEGTDSAETATGTGASNTQTNENNAQSTGTNSVMNSENTESSVDQSTDATPINSSLSDDSSSSEGTDTNDGQNSVTTNPSNEENDTKETKVAIEDNSATIDRVDKDKTDTETKVDEANKNASWDEVKKQLQDIQKDLNDFGLEITVENTEQFKDDATNLDDLIKNLNTYTEHQITDIKNAVEAYKLEAEKYAGALTNFNKFKEELKTHGLWKDDNTDPSTLHQWLVFGDEDEAKVEITSKNQYVTQNDGENWKPGDFLSHFVIVQHESISGELFSATYTNLKHTSYNGQSIDKIVITFSDWTYNPKYNSGRNPGIYLTDNPADGFWYINSDGVTMDLQLYSNGKVVKLDKNAYFVAGSLNSEGLGHDYIEKAQIINDKNNSYGGEGISLPESEVTVHKGENSSGAMHLPSSESGGDVLYSDININFFDDLNNGKTLDKLVEEGMKLWNTTREKAEYKIKNYLGWDAQPDELANREDKDEIAKRKIYGTGVFKVYGDRIKVRFSDAVGSGWVTYSSDIPDLTFNEELPSKPILTYTPNTITWEEKSDITIHYVDVNGVNKDDTSLLPSDGVELKYQNFADLIADGTYSIENLWNFANENYVFVTIGSEIPGVTISVDHKNLSNIVISKDHKDIYIYLNHATRNEEDQKEEVTQVVHYKDKVTGETVAADKTQTITFVKHGVTDLFTGETTWTDWLTKTPDFTAEESPDLSDKHLLLEDPENGKTAGGLKAEATDPDSKHEYTVYYVHATQNEEDQEEKVTQVVHYKDKVTGETVAADKTQTITFVKHGVTDLFTGETTWTDWLTKTPDFTAEESPDLSDKHLLLEDPENGKTAGGLKAEATDPDSKHEYTVYYVHETKSEEDRVEDVKRVIHYVDRVTGETVAPDAEEVIHFIGHGVTDLFTGNTTWAWEAETKDGFEAVTSPDLTSEHLLLEKSEDKTAGEYKGVQAKDPDSKYEYTVYYVHATKNEEDQKELVTQVVHYKDKVTGATVATDKTQTITFVKHGVTDLFTGETTWTDWLINTPNFTAEESPDLSGKHLLLEDPENGKTAGGLKAEATDPDSKHEHTVYYVHETRNEEDKEEVVNQVVHYKDKETGATVATDKTQTITFVKHGVTDLFTGETTWTDWLINTPNFTAEESPDLSGKHLLLEDPENGKTAGGLKAEATDPDSKHEHTVYYVHETENISRDKAVTQIIHYVYEGGGTAHEDYTATLKFTQTGVKDLFTEKETWNGEWTLAQTFVTVTSPDIPGYTPDRKEVGPYTIEVTNDNFDDNLDKENTVIYKANSVTPDPGTDPDPKPTPDPTPTSDPDPDPTPTPDPVDPEDPAPLPEEDPGSEYPDQPEFTEEEESVEPHDTVEPKKGTSKVAPQTNVVTEQTTPETVSTETSGVTEESQTTTEVTHTNNEETLPETGEKHNEFAKVMSGLAAALGLTGLAATSKRRRKATAHNRRNKKNGK